jgi:circadian clock protein KaiC
MNKCRYTGGISWKGYQRGIKGLDIILKGGFLIKGRSYLVVGEAGTGKTILSIQFLLEGVKNNEKCLFISLAEPVEEIERNIKNFGWSLEGIDLIDLTPKEVKETGEYRVFPPSEVEAEEVWGSILKAIEEKNPQRVVIDGASFLLSLSTDEYQFRKKMLGLINYLYSKKITSIITFEPTDLQKETCVSLAVDGVIKLRRELSRNRVIEIRSIEIQKLRGSDYIGGLHPLKIKNEGIVVFPRIIERQAEEKIVGETLPSGIPQLDEILGGGLEFGTSTIISGPSGVGKTTLGVHYIVRAAGFGKKAVLYAFEESPSSIIKRAMSVSIPIDVVLKDGRLKIVQVNPMEFYPDEFLEMVRRDVEKDGRKVVMIDSVKGFELAMEEFGSLLANMQNLNHYLNRQECTTIFINELEEIAGGVKVTERGISYLFDNAILIRYAEINSRVVKVIGVVKKRIGEHKPDLREMKITKEGIRVGETIEGFEGILTGVPRKTE